MSTNFGLNKVKSEFNSSKEDDGLGQPPGLELFCQLVELTKQLDESKREHSISRQQIIDRDREIIKQKQDLENRNKELNETTKQLYAAYEIISTLKLESTEFLKFSRSDYQLLHDQLVDAKLEQAKHVAQINKDRATINVLRDELNELKCKIHAQSAAPDSLQLQTKSLIDQYNISMENFRIDNNIISPMELDALMGSPQAPNKPKQFQDLTNLRASLDSASRFDQIPELKKEPLERFSDKSHHENINDWLDTTHRILAASNRRGDSSENCSRIFRREINEPNPTNKIKITTKQQNQPYPQICSNVNKFATATCQKCGRRGHSAEECRQHLICDNCKKKGHTIKTCNRLNNFKNDQENQHYIDYNSHFY